eukprot:Pgem_evm1s7338
MSEVENPQNIVIDMDYEDKMNDPDFLSLAKQVELCYSHNRFSNEPSHLYITSMGGEKTKSIFSKTVPSYGNWD